MKKSEDRTKVVNEVVRPDPQPNQDKNVVPPKGVIPEHRADDVQGVIQYKTDGNAPIREKLPDESDLQEGKITPAAVMTPTVERHEDTDVRVYANGVTQADINEGRVSGAAVREIPPSTDPDRQMHDVITHARNKTQLSRLNHDEAIAVFRQLEADGYKIVKTGGRRD